MQIRTLTALALLVSVTATAQYGTFNAASVKAAKSETVLVVLDATDTPYNKAIMNAMKSNWKFNENIEFVNIDAITTAPIAEDKLYLVKTSKVDPVKFEGTFLTLMQGWKAKKNDKLEMKDNAFTTFPVEQELAYILIDEKGMAEKSTSSLINLYVKHLQDYLKQVESGKITDKTTADRIYSSRTRFVREAELWMAKEHLDKTIPDAAKVKEFYTAPAQLMDLAQLMSAVQSADKSVVISDVVLTGDYKNKHTFKRVFNAGTGELMYLNDDAAIYGKKEGFIEEDLKNLERAR
ncbi:MAG: hypothetical protein IPI00_08205 [Flavobacteriales bacterium]|nr:hypothetical protein [Flavobacteriales bacterium]MBK6943940.1 hypothetical protein [Flavobacteriales bacterium]MBK7240148.1 hypothetical protein [Flavobacteriales bacterium]MBK7297827.1 hypothetical protein [Flavobacteriales bacterium]MBK9533611.1 hypothetical protein [Flavobacteriales bacterium]